VVVGRAAIVVAGGGPLVVVAPPVLAVFGAGFASDPSGAGLLPRGEGLVVAVLFALEPFGRSAGGSGRALLRGPSALARDVPDAKWRSTPRCTPGSETEPVKPAMTVST